MATLKLTGFVQNPVSGAGVPGARVFVFGRDIEGNRIADPSAEAITEASGRYEVEVDTAVVQTRAEFGYWIEYRNTVSPNQTRIIRTDVEYQVKYIHGLEDAHQLIPAPLMDGSIKTEMLANADATKDRGITQAKMRANSVGTAQLIDFNVTLDKLATDSVNASKIVDLSVGTAELANLSVTQAKLATPSVGLAQMIDGTINTAKLADQAVTSLKIADNSIMNVDINTAADISGSKLLNTSVPYAKLSTDVLTNLDPRYVRTAGNSSVDGDLTLHRSSIGGAGTGVIFLGVGNTHFVYWNGTQYEMPGGRLVSNGSEVITTANISGQSVNYATSAGSATTAGSATNATNATNATTASNANALGGQGIGYFSPAGHGHSYADPAHTHAYLPSGGKAADSNLLDGIDSLSFLRYRSGSYSGNNIAGWQVSYGASDVANVVMLHIFEANGSTWILSGSTGYGVGFAVGAGPGSDEVFNAGIYIRVNTSSSYFEVGYTNAGLGANYGGSTYRWVVAYTT